MTRKQTSAKVSKLAAKYLAMNDDEMHLHITFGCGDSGERSRFIKDIRTLAASCLSQDEVKGAKPKKEKARWKPSLSSFR